MGSIDGGKSLVTCIMMFLILLLLSHIAAADTLHLKSGKVLHGVIIEERDCHE